MKSSRLLHLARDYREPLVRLALASSLSALAGLTIPWLAGDLVAAVVRDDPNLHFDISILGLLVLALLTAAVLNVASAIQSTVLEARVLTDLRQRVFEHVQRLPIGFHESRGKGDTLALMTYEVAQLSHFFTGTFAIFPARLLTAIGAVAVMFSIDPRMAVIVPLLIPAFYLVLKVVGRSLRGVAASIQHAEADVVQLAEQALDILPATKAFSREVVVAAKYRGATEEAARLSISRGRIEALVDPMLGLIAAVASVLVLIAAGQGVREGNLQIDELFRFGFYAMLLTRPASALSHIYGQTQSALGTSARLRSVLDQPLEVVSSKIAPWRATGAIEFRDIHFSFPGRPPLLRSLNLTIEPGEKVAIVGPNGSGKTALVNLLMRYYEPDSGTVLIDGKDIRDYALAQLRQQIGLVPQTPMLFNASIRDNVMFGSGDASPVDLNNALRLAQAKEFIDEMPRGLDTMIGDRGLRLSGGQKQRLALARALIKDPPILILDEATSMFDVGGEDAFTQGIVTAVEQRTVIFITHRPRLLELADRVIELNNGRIVVDRPNSGRR